MEFTFPELLRAFLCSLLLGFFEGLLYEPVRLLRAVGPAGRLWYFFTDAVFMVICAFLTFFFSLAMLEGSVRFFVIIGEVLGFSAFAFTVRPLANKIYAPLIKFFDFFVKKLLKSASKLLYNIIGISKSICEFISKRVMIYGRTEKGSSRRGDRGENRRS